MSLLGAAAAHATQRAQAPGTRVEVRPTLTIEYLALNLRRPLFRNNPRLARALNYALDRPALIRARGLAAGTAIDRLMPYDVPGRSRSRLYPLDGPDVGRARALAQGHTRGGKARIGARERRSPSRVAVPAIQAAFELLGIDTEVVVFDLAHTPPLDVAYYDVDVLVDVAVPSFPDARAYVEVARSDAFRGRFNRTEPPNFRRPAWDRRFARAAALTGVRRARAYDRLDRDLMRQAPPVVPYMVRNARFVVADRVGCFTYHAAYGLDLAAICVR